MVYGLQDGRNGVIRYIGSTSNPVHRYLSHVANRDSKGNTSLSDWRVATGEHIQMIALKIVEPAIARQEEEISIRQYASNGLLNNRAARQRVYTSEQALAILNRHLSQQETRP